jgi:chromosome segregation protein
MEKNFKQSLVSIQKHFQEIFQQLFGGGHAQLVMTDPENILETGVEINAQPPGKKLQNMNLLSGGEKTLTAISLLFAFLRKRPSPFAVLDEIEAALDDANVDRFADFLKGFAKETQFIIVTHQKKTMEIADALYGVTMQEPGVSQVISLKLTEKVS